MAAGIGNSGSYATPRLDLAQAFMEFQTDQAFIAPRVMPMMTVQRKAGTYSRITRETLVGWNEGNRRAPGGAYQRTGFEAEDATYACEEYGEEIPVDDSQRALYRNDFDADLVSARVARHRLLLAQEVRVAAAAFNTSTFAGAALFTDRSGAPWDNAASDVIGHVLAAQEIVRRNTGILPQSMVIGKATMNNILANTGILAKMQQTVPLTVEEKRRTVAGILGLEEIIVGSAVKNSANQGQTHSGADVWSDDYALICVIDNSGSLAMPCWGRSFLWTEDSPSNEVVESYREEQTRSDVIRVRHNVDEVTIDAYFGHLLQVD